MNANDLANPSRRHFTTAAGALTLASALPTALAQGSKPFRVMLTATQVPKLRDTMSGTYLPEIAYPFQYFREQGCTVDIVTPNGGPAAIYDAGNLSEKLSAIKNDAAFIAAHSTSLAIAAVNVDAYDAIFFPGGHGQYFDVLNDERFAEATTRIQARGGVVGTAGHGVVCLTQVRNTDGSFWVKGKEMTCFP